MIEKFDVRDVKANPARFDIDKAISIRFFWLLFFCLILQYHAER